MSFLPITSRFIHFTKIVSYSILFAILFIFVGQSSAQTNAYEQIDSFNSDITINQDRSVDITETIFYQTNQEKHGIYRYVPTIYSQNGFRNELAISNVSVTDEHNQPIPFQTTTDGPFLTFKIGDPNSTFTGNQTYRISYSIANALNNEENDFQELYWDITGEGWNFPIAFTTATISSPYATISDAVCFSGKVGSNDGKCTIQKIDAQKVYVSYDQEISFNDNLTISLKLPIDESNTIQRSTLFEKTLHFFTQNWSLLIVPLPLLLMIVAWLKNGRDYEFISKNVFNIDTNRPQRKRWPSIFSREPFVYAPIDHLTPGQAGTLINGKADTRDIVAEILELARKKYLLIELIETKKLLGTKRDYQFTKLSENKHREELSEVQSYLYAQLFKTNDKILISKLKGTFHTSMAKASQKLEQSLVDSEIYTSKPSATRQSWIGISVLISAIVAGMVGWQFLVVDIFWPIGLVLIQIPFCLIIAYNMTQRTAVGTNLWLQTRGLRKSIRYGKWREKIKEKNLFIEEILPFAVALNVVDKLSKDMEDLQIAPPEYLSGGAHSMASLNALNTQAFVQNFSKEVGSNLSYNPSSASSGGSGFSGGSSGGGGGGGGGGSW